MKIYLEFIGTILSVSVGCAAALAVIAVIVWRKMHSTFEERVCAEVDRRMQDLKIVSRFNVRVDVVEDPLSNGTTKKDAPRDSGASENQAVTKCCAV